MKTIKLFAVALFALMAAGAQAQTEKVTLDGDHGKLQAVIHKPTLKQGERVPMVVLCHGFMGNMQIVSPQSAKEELKKMAQAALAALAADDSAE